MLSEDRKNVLETNVSGAKERQLTSFSIKKAKKKSQLTAVGLVGGAHTVTVSRGPTTKYEARAIHVLRCIRSTTCVLRLDVVSGVAPSAEHVSAWPCLEVLWCTQDRSICYLQPHLQLRVVSGRVAKFRLDEFVGGVKAVVFCGRKKLLVPFMEHWRCALRGLT